MLALQRITKNINKCYKKNDVNIIYNTRLWLSTTTSLSSNNNNNNINVKKTTFQNGVTFNETSNSNNDNDKTLVIFCGWMSSTDRQLKKYLEYYHGKNLNTLQFSVGVPHVFNPTFGTEHMKDILDITINTIKPEQIIFHHFSIGGFLYGQMLRVLMDDPMKYEEQINQKIKGQIFDSPPDMNSIPEGLAAHFFPSEQNPLRFLVKFTIEIFMKITASTNGVEWKASSNAFHNNYLKHAPSLWFYSKADPVSRFEDCETVINKWKHLGIDVTAIRWDDTPHIQHGRKDPDRYFGELDTFLTKVL